MAGLVGTVGLLVGVLPGFLVARNLVGMGGLQVGMLPLKSLGFSVAGGLGGRSRACISPPGGSTARRTGWRGDKVPWETLGLEGSAHWTEEGREREREVQVIVIQ